MAKGLKDALQDAVKDAMRGGDRERRTVLRSATAAIKQREVDQRVDLTGDDAAVIEILSKLVKQRRESAAVYRDAGEEARAKAEEHEALILSEFLPAAADEAEIDALIEEALTATGAATIKDMGRVMAQLKPKLQGRADLSAVSARVKQRLGAS